MGGAYRAALAYYRNVGTRTRPVFRFVTDDYLGLAAQHLQDLKPALVDLNRDGVPDLVYGAWDGSTTALYYRLNTVSSGYSYTDEIDNPACALQALVVIRIGLYK